MSIGMNYLAYLGNGRRPPRGTSGPGCSTHHETSSTKLNMGQLVVAIWLGLVPTYGRAIPE